MQLYEYEKVFVLQENTLDMVQCGRITFSENVYENVSDANSFT